MRGAVLVIGFLLLLAGCGQDLEVIVVPAPEQTDPAAACAVAPEMLVSRDQALCIAKVAGLPRGITRWTVREYETVIDVFNTSRKYPIAEGVNVRMARRGGAVLEKSRWQAVTVE